MLNEQDLQAIGSLILKSQDTIMNTIMDEIGRTYGYLDKKIDKLQKNIDELNRKIA